MCPGKGVAWTSDDLCNRAGGSPQADAPADWQSGGRMAEDVRHELRLADIKKNRGDAQSHPRHPAQALVTWRLLCVCHVRDMLLRDRQEPNTPK